MKLRIRGNSIRLRLTQSEVKQFDEIGVVGEMVDLGPASSAFRYELNRAGKDDLINATFEHNCLSVSVPMDEAKDWVRSERIGLEVIHSIGDNKFLRIVVEKDFACLTPRDNEDESDAFANPLAHVSCA